MSFLDRVHGRVAHPRRARSIAAEVGQRLPHGASVVDIGCGDGLLARTLLDSRPDLDIVGYDTLARDGARIEVHRFDGRSLPLAAGAVDYALLVDVVHHVVDQEALLNEALRVARHGLVLKDHLKEGFLAGPTLRFMDWVGNARHGVSLPYRYLTRDEWDRLFERLGVRPRRFDDALDLYPGPAGWVFGRSLHFIAHLARDGNEGCP